MPDPTADLYHGDDGVDVVRDARAHGGRQHIEPGHVAEERRLILACKVLHVRINEW